MNHEAWAWLIALVVFMVAEGATAQLVSVWFIGGSISALITALCGGALWLQFVLFFAVSGVMLAALRPLLRKYITPKQVPTNADRNIGMTAIVSHRIDNLASEGRAKVDGKDWAARSEDGSVIERGECVTVRRIEGARLIVERQTVASRKK